MKIKIYMSYSNSNLKFYAEDSEILTLQGICPTENKKEYLICGTQSNDNGLVYKGIIPIKDYKTVKYPNSTSTSVYGPEYISKCLCKDLITLVGSYQTGIVALDEPCTGFVYRGEYVDLNNPENYSEIKPIEDYKFTVVHSTRAGLAVYISSNETQGNFFIGKSFIYDLDKKETISEVIYPGSNFTTTYGIWYNGRIKCDYDLYTISGGFSETGVFDLNIFVVDLIYNRRTGEKHYENWTKISLPGISLLSRAQGITEIKKDTYILPVENLSLDLKNNFVQINGGKVTIKKENGKYITINYETINFPEAKLTIITSAANNAVTGVSINSNNDVFSFEAVNSL